METRKWFEETKRACGAGNLHRGERRENIKVVLTGHAMDRISERFGSQNPARIVDVFGRALTDGLVSADGNGTLIEYGSLLIAAERCDGALVVKTVLNLSHGISEKLREELSHEKPSPWNRCKVVLPGDEGGDA